MIASLRGIIQSKDDRGIILDVAGVGYLIHFPYHYINELPDIGNELFLHIYTHVREDLIQLYGFPSKEERELFGTLIKISGIGPKLALSLLSKIPIEQFGRIIAEEDVSMLSTVPGLGKKTAAKIIIELKEKMPFILEKEEEPIVGDAVSALMNLGYKKGVAKDAVKAVVKNNHGSSIEEIIKEALKYISVG
ncbi:MAG: Holliday junction branch migration protein RuvA [Nitrospirae bacterium]|nr:MAG: Holliday junction branch migration protein RuvA [Nitrospirota bacterium]